MTDTEQQDQTGKIRKNEAARIVARVLFQRDWTAANPEASREERQQAWKEARKDETRKARGLVRALAKAGVVLSVTDARRGDQAAATHDESEDAAS